MKSPQRKVEEHLLSSREPFYHKGLSRPSPEVRFLLLILNRTVRSDTIKDNALWRCLLIAPQQSERNSILHQHFTLTMFSFDVFLPDL